MSPARARCSGRIAIVCALVLAQRSAFAQQPPPLKTWGGSTGTVPSDSSPPTTPPTRPADSTETNAGASDIAPPPSTIGTPIQSGNTTDSPPAPPPKVEAPESEAIVHAPGHVGLRYALEGIEVRGNTTTLA